MILTLHACAHEIFPQQQNLQFVKLNGEFFFSIHAHVLKPQAVKVFVGIILEAQSIDVLFGSMLRRQCAHGGEYMLAAALLWRAIHYGFNSSGSHLHRPECCGVFPSRSVNIEATLTTHEDSGLEGSCVIFTMLFLFLKIQLVKLVYQSGRGVSHQHAL